jgi:hypothetical protein
MCKFCKKYINYGKSREFMGLSNREILKILSQEGLELKYRSPSGGITDRIYVTTNIHDNYRFRIYGGTKLTYQYFNVNDLTIEVNYMGVFIYNVCNEGGYHYLLYS